MSPVSLTFAQLKTAMSERSRAGEAVSANSLPNALSALAQFMGERGLRDDGLVGTHLRDGYHGALNKHVEALVTEKRSKAYIRNRRALLKQWRALTLELDRVDAAQSASETPFQRALRQLLAGGLPVKTAASRAGVPLATLKRWLKGSLPQRAKLSHVARLERYFGQPPGALTDLLPMRLSDGEERVTPAVPTQMPYRVRLAEQVKLQYSLKESSPKLVKQWQDLLVHKSSPLSSEIKRQRKGKWSVTNRPLKPQESIRWFESVPMLGKAGICPTAAVNWTHVSQFLGWLVLPVDSGGKGLPSESAQSLSCLLDGQHLQDYVFWRAARSGGVLHRGLAGILKLVASLCHPSTGYLTQCRTRFPEHEDAHEERAWASTCQSVFERARELTQQVEADGELSRDPRAPVASILALPNPLHAVSDAITRMESERPNTGGQAEAIWARDKLMLKLLTSNPLRAKNLKLLTILPSASGEPGQLRKVHGIWRIAIDKKDFKNMTGAAKNRVYDMPVRKEVWNDIEIYLERYRPLLASSTNPYLLVSSESPDGPMYNLNRRFQTITKRYFSDCPGVGPHVMRHIVATTILKKHPNAWAAAAYVLHDQEETVRKNYAHLASADAARWLDEMMTESLAGL